MDLWRLPCPGSEGAAQVTGKAARLQVHRAAHTPPPPASLVWGPAPPQGASLAPRKQCALGRAEDGCRAGAPSSSRRPTVQQPPACPPAFTERPRLAAPEPIQRAPFPPPWLLPSAPPLFLPESSLPWVSILAVPRPCFSFPVPGQGEGTPAKGHSGGPWVLTGVLDALPEPGPRGHVACGGDSGVADPAGAADPQRDGLSSISQCASIPGFSERPGPCASRCQNRGRLRVAGAHLFLYPGFSLPAWGPTERLWGAFSPF